jgi:hypothetical protein
MIVAKAIPSPFTAREPRGHLKLLHLGLSLSVAELVVCVGADERGRAAAQTSASSRLRSSSFIEGSEAASSQHGGLSWRRRPTMARQNCSQ